MSILATISERLVEFVRVFGELPPDVTVSEDEFIELLEEFPGLNLLPDPGVLKIANRPIRVLPKVTT